MFLKHNYRFIKKMLYLPELEKVKILDALWESADIGMALVDKEGKFLKVNPKFCNMLEYTESELLTKTYQSITHPDDLYADIQSAKEILNKERRNYIITKRYLPKSGDCIIWTRLHVEAIWDNELGFLYFLSQAGDFVIQQKETQRVIKKAVKKELTFLDILKWFLKHWKVVITVISLLGSLVYGGITFYNKLDGMLKDYESATRHSKVE